MELASCGQEAATTNRPIAPGKMRVLCPPGTRCFRGHFLFLAETIGIKFLIRIDLKDNTFLSPSEGEKKACGVLLWSTTLAMTAECFHYQN
jgi:hypothetical protein